MPNPTSYSGIRDNHRRGAVADFLKARILPGARLSVVSAYFTIFAYDALKAQLDGIQHLDFLFGEPRFLDALDPEKTEKKSFVIDADGLNSRIDWNRNASHGSPSVFLTDRGGIELCWEDQEGKSIQGELTSTGAEFFHSATEEEGVVPLDGLAQLASRLSG